jgi:hypothetical protein
MQNIIILKMFSFCSSVLVNDVDFLLAWKRSSLQCQHINLYAKILNVLFVAVGVIKIMLFL